MIRELVGDYKWGFIFAMLLSAASALAGLALIALVNKEINSPAGLASSIEERILIYIGVLAGFFIISFLSQFILAILSARLVYRLRSAMFRRILATSFENKERLGGHKIHATITTDIGSIANALGILPLMSFNLTSIIFSFSYVAYLSLYGFAIVFSVILFSILISKYLISKGHNHFNRLREQDDELFKSFKTLVDGGKELCLNRNRREHFYNSQALPSAGNVRDATVDAQIYWNLNNTWSNSMVFLSLGMLVFVSGLYLPMDNKVLVGSALALLYLRGPFAFLTQSLQSVSQGIVAYRKIDKLQLNSLSGYSDDRLNKQYSSASDDWETLTSTGICYRYRDGEKDYQFAIGPIDLTIHRGEVIFICGGNGSGKSTFIKVLIGLYSPTEGELSLGNTKINAGNLQWYQNQFSTIFSDFYLFDRILDADGNLASGAAIQPHLEKLRLNKKVTITNGKLSTIDLSHGQKKRLALLLAYLEDAPIYVFDEWAADQDPYFREYFYTQLLPELKAQKKIVIVISHDEKYFHTADRLYKLNNGQVESQSLSESLPESLSEKYG